MDESEPGRLAVKLAVVQCVQCEHRFLTNVVGVEDFHVSPDTLYRQYQSYNCVNTVDFLKVCLNNISAHLHGELSRFLNHLVIHLLLSTTKGVYYADAHRFKL